MFSESINPHNLNENKKWKIYVDGFRLLQKRENH